MGEPEPQKSEVRGQPPSPLLEPQGFRLRRNCGVTSRRAKEVSGQSEEESELLDFNVLNGFYDFYDFYGFYDFYDFYDFNGFYDSI